MTTPAPKHRGLPSSTDVPRLLTAVRELLNVWKGDTGDALDRVLTVRDLVDPGIINVRSSGVRTLAVTPGSAIGGSGGSSGSGNASLPPAAVTNLSASGAVRNALLQWDDLAAGSYSHYEILRNGVDNASTAVVIGTSLASVYADSDVASAQTYYYWVRGVSTGGVNGPINQTAGTPATIQQVGTADIAVGAITADSAILADLAVVNAKIADAAVTNAKIGQFIQSANYVPGFSGWYVDKNGSAEFNSMIIRGSTVIGGSLTGTSGSFSGTVYVQNLEGDVIDKVVQNIGQGPEYEWRDRPTAPRAFHAERLRFPPRSFQRYGSVEGFRMYFYWTGRTPFNHLYMRIYGGPHGAENTLLFDSGMFTPQNITYQYNDVGGTTGMEFTSLQQNLNVSQRSYFTGSAFVIVVEVKYVGFSIPANMDYGVLLLLDDAGPDPLYGSYGRAGRYGGMRIAEAFKQQNANVYWTL